MRAAAANDRGYSWTSRALGGRSFNIRRHAFLQLRQQKKRHAREIRGATLGKFANEFFAV